MTMYEQRIAVVKLRSRDTLKSLRPNHYKKKAPAGLDPMVLFILDEIDRQRLSEQRVAVEAGLAMDTIRYWRTARTRHGRTVGAQAPSLPNVRAVLNVLGYELSAQPLPEKSKRSNLISKSTCLISKSIA